MTDYVKLEDATDKQLAYAALAYIMEGTSYEPAAPGTDPTLLRHTEGTPPHGWPFDPAKWLPGSDARVNYSRAKGYLDYLVNRTPPEDEGTPVELTIK